MPNKKHYWTQILLVTTIVTCCLGLAVGFLYSPKYPPQIATPQKASNRTATPFEVQPYSAKRMMPPPYSSMSHPEHRSQPTEYNYKLPVMWCGNQHRHVPRKR